MTRLMPSPAVPPPSPPAPLPAAPHAGSGAATPGSARWTQRLDSPRWLLSALALWLLATLGLRPLLLPDEGRYANVAREMLVGAAPDAWFVPTLNGLPFFHKPPLMYWLDMAAMQLFGITPFAARAAPLLGAWAMGAALYLAMRRWHGARIARIALAVLATSPFFFFGGQYANHDMLVAGLITLAVLCLARAVDEPPRVNPRWLVAGWVACALAVLAKGLIGIVLPALVIGPWLLAQGRWRQTLGLLHPLGPLAFLAVAAPWFVAVQLRYPGFFDYFFVEQHFRRFAQTSFNNVRPFWFFALVVPLLTLPWSLWLPAAARRLLPLRHDPVQRATLGLYFWWGLAVLGFFSLPSSKLVGYALPALAPWCALLAWGMALRPVQPPRMPSLGGRAWRASLLAAALLCAVGVAGLTWTAPHSNRAAARVLAAQLQRAPDDRVVMVDEYLYDVPFYANLKRPVLIASTWSDPDLPRHDNWRKELFDAARFAPSVGQAVLWPLERLADLPCGNAAAWFVIKPQHAPQVLSLPGANRVYADPNTELWRVPGRACAALEVPQALPAAQAPAAAPR